MKDLQSVWPLLSFAANVLVLLIGGLAMRWIAGLVKGIEDRIEIAVLRLKNELRDQFATAEQLQKLEEDLRRELDVVGRVEGGFAHMQKLLIKQRNDAPRAIT